MIPFQSCLFKTTIGSSTEQIDLSPDYFSNNPELAYVLINSKSVGGELSVLLNEGGTRNHNQVCDVCDTSKNQRKQNQQLIVR